MNRRPQATAIRPWSGSRNRASQRGVQLCQGLVVATRTRFCVELLGGQPGPEQRRRARQRLELLRRVFAAVGCAHPALGVDLLVGEDAGKVVVPDGREVFTVERVQAAVSARLVARQGPHRPPTGARRSSTIRHAGAPERRRLPPGIAPGIGRIQKLTPEMRRDTRAVGADGFPCVFRAVMLPPPAVPVPVPRHSGPVTLSSWTRCPIRPPPAGRPNQP